MSLTPSSASVSKSYPDIVFFLPRPFWPPYAGPCRHCHFEAQSLSAKGYSVHLITISSPPRDSSFVQSLPYRSISYIIPRPWNSIRSFIRALLSAFFKFLPFTSQVYSSSSYLSDFRLICSSFPVESTILHFFTIRSHPFFVYASSLGYKSVVELIDSYTLNLRTRLKHTSVIKEPLAYFFLLVESYLYSFLEKSLPSLPNILAYSVVTAFDCSFLKLKPSESWASPPLLKVTSIAADFPPLSMQKLSEKIQLQALSPTLLFFGSLYYYPNVQALQYFADHIVGPLRLDFPGIRVIVAGSNPSPTVLRLCRKSSCFELHRNVPSLIPLFDASLCSVAPVLSGSGQQNKILESIAHGLPVLTTTFAAQALGLTEEHVFLCDKPTDWTKSLMDLFLFGEETLRKVHRSYHYCKERYSWDSVTASFVDFYT
jgi:glycosyltransferase involved in cell wall biosynthesis